MTYGTGVFDRLDEEKEPGIYFQLIQQETIDYTGQYGGVAIPASLISCSPEVGTRPDFAIPVTKGTISLVIGSQYTFAQETTLRSMVTEALRNASTVYLCPDDDVAEEVPEPIVGIGMHGKGRKASANASFASDATFELLNGIKVVLKYKGIDKVTLQFYSPDGIQCLKTPKEVAVDSVTKQGSYTAIAGDLATTSGAGLYATNPEKTYADAEFTIYIHEPYENGDAEDEIYLIGGSGKYAELTTRTNELVKGKTITKGCYVACSMKIDAVATTGTNALSRDTANHIFAYIKNTMGYVGSLSGYYLVITPPSTTTSSGTASLCYIDMSANMYPAQTRSVEDRQFANDATVKDILGAFAGIIEIVEVGNVTTSDTWGKLKINANTVKNKLIIGFSPIFPRIDPFKRFEAFVRIGGRTPASILYEPYWTEDMKSVVTQDDVVERYQKFQKTYLDMRGKYAALTQLLMDESLSQLTRAWAANVNMRMYPSPFFISARTGKGGKTYSQKNGAHTAGLLAACGAYESANGVSYTGSAGITLYTQAEIEEMYHSGVLTYHDQDGDTQIYIDTNTYRQAQDMKNQLPESCERNQTIRAALFLIYQIKRMFYSHYFHNQLMQSGITEQKLHHEIIRIIQKMHDDGAFGYPNAADVVVTAVTPRKYHARIYVRTVEAPEVLMISMGV
ncbi:MAG: hypothetical protein MJ014_00125 [Methanocorpusculum sp.]|nr:hypothetical protein [Methanocorpusculum sp.]